MYTRIVSGSAVPVGSLAFTGFHTMWWIVAGVSLAVAGMSLIRLGRSRRQKIAV